MSAGHLCGWIGGNQLHLFENGGEFSPRVFECTAMAEREVVVEKFILFEDNVGRALHAALLKVAARGAPIDLTIDGYGLPDLSREFISTLLSTGIGVKGAAERKTRFRRDR